MKKRLGLTPSMTASLADNLMAGDPDEGNLELVALSRIQLDPENPRRLGINPEDVASGFDPSEQRWAPIRAQADKLFELANSVRTVGLQQPIKIYRFGEGFRIAFGERRFLACVIAEKHAVPAVILSERPHNLRLLQLTENIQRDDLTAWLRVQNVEAVIAELRAPKSLTSDQLGKVISVSPAQAHRYLVVINGPEEVRDALADGRINNLKTAAAIAAIKDPEARRRAIENGSAAAVEEASSTQPVSPAVRAQTSSRGRPAAKVNLGTTPKTAVVRRIIECVTPELGQGVDWDNMASVKAAFRALIEKLEAETE